MKKCFAYAIAGDALLLLSKAIATIGFTVKTESWKGKNASLYQYHRQFLERFF